MGDLSLYGDKRMTVKEVAEALNVDRTTITRIVNKLFAKLMQHGMSTYLDEIQVVAIKRWIGSGRNDLDNVVQVRNIETDLEMALLDKKVSEWKDRKIAELTIAAEAATKALEVARPKIDFYDAVADSTDTIDMGDVAKVLNIPGMGRNNLFAFLRGKKILMHDNQPYQEYISRGYFRTAAFTTANGSVHPVMKTVVFQKGLDFIRKTLEAGR